MQNLAGRNRPKADNDKQILTELARCGINRAEYDCENSEVQTNYNGVLGVVTFTRAWTYWVASGTVALSIAKKIYEHPVGRTDIRVGGHCGCVAPEAPWVEWRDPITYKKYARTLDREQIEKFKDNHPDMYKTFIDNHLFHDDPASCGAIGTVDCYHIDTELGLYVFAQFLKGEL